MATKQYSSFKDFYPFYLSEHKDPTNRFLHFAGSSVVLCLLLVSIFTSRPSLLWLLPVAGYGFAWVGHFVFEKNKPATFKYPFYSFVGDWRMFYDILRGEIGFTTGRSGR